MSANDEQVGGTHYKDMGIQSWDFMRECMSAEAFSGYLQGCCIKYLSRFQRKGGVEDLRKARHYLDKLIEVSEPFAETLNRAVKESLMREYEQPGASESEAANTAEDAAIEHIEEFRQARGLDWFVLTLGKDGDDNPHTALSNQIERLVPVQMAGSPAVSESAAGNDYQFDCSKVGKTDFNQHCPCCGKWGHIPSNWPSAEWPGPDWSKAPEWAAAWAADLEENEETKTRFHWFSVTPTTIFSDGGVSDYWFFPSSTVTNKFSAAPSFNYPGHWRDSLRRRPTPAA